MVKRLVDIAASVFLLILTAPILLVLGAFVRSFIGPPVIFRQQRSGFRGKPFILFKFRTMTNNLNSDGMLMSDAKRLTKLGHFLRIASLDELPELWNVLKGDMSLVGPRPLLMEYLDHYSEEQLQRHNVKPGITGWAQINGRNQTTWDERFDLDRWYVENQSFLLDLKIMSMTVLRVLQREGISANGMASMPRFEGSHSEKE